MYEDLECLESYVELLEVDATALQVKLDNMRFGVFESEEGNGACLYAIRLLLDHITTENTPRKLSKAIRKCQRALDPAVIRS